ncbi:hypothetical protein HAX54_015159 [Datura stramonium]|uniref:Uncharacterized protein n=1 Tax=Datura stramonium TaxID=4076 RepID=A0ABS8RZB0_DATST|nr:hypothetical protein [Datura stramonium]
MERSMFKVKWRQVYTPSENKVKKIKLGKFQRALALAPRTLRGTLSSLKIFNKFSEPRYGSVSANCPHNDGLRGTLRLNARRVIGLTCAN